jgi:hypothetical protein
MGKNLSAVFGQEFFLSERHVTYPAFYRLIRNICDKSQIWGFTTGISKASHNSQDPFPAFMVKLV